MLKVSFFGPFYAGYNVIAIDADYQYALVAGDNLNYLWLLSRTGRLPDSVRDNYLQLARKAGFKTEDLIWVNQDR
jgi:apolipoprotein D and lipocalin family protein